MIILGFIALLTTYGLILLQRGVGIKD
jgi:hypothetical protein